MKKSMRIIASLLLAAMLVPAMAACGEAAADTPAAGTTAAETTAEAVETAPTHDANGYLLDDIPADLDYDGRTVNILKWDHYEITDFNVEEENGEILNDALYNRNLVAEDRLNIRLEFPQVTARDKGETLIKTLQASIMSGLGAYDAAGINSTRNSNAAVGGLYLDLNNIDYLDFDKPWWSQKDP